MGIRKSQVEKALRADGETDDARTSTDRKRAQAVFSRACQNANEAEREEVWQGLLNKWSR